MSFTYCPPATRTTIPQGSFRQADVILTADNNHPERKTS